VKPRSAPRFCGIVGAMNTRIAFAAALLLGVASAGAGCGSGGAPKSEGGMSTCQPDARGAGTMSWLHDGTTECADSTATFKDLPLYTTFSLTGQSATTRILINVSTVFAPGPIGGNYTCAPLGSLSVTFYYMPGQANNYGPNTCALTLNMQGTEGVHATGTFSATFDPPVEGTTGIMNGVFDAPVTIGNGS